jgi:hypothetical protein
MLGSTHGGDVNDMLGLEVAGCRDDGTAERAPVYLVAFQLDAGATSFTDFSGKAPNVGKARVGRIDDCVNSQFE